MVEAFKRFATCLGLSVLCFAACSEDGSGPGPGPAPLPIVPFPEETPLAAAPVVAFVGVNVLPMTSEEILPDQTVITRDGMIAEIGSASTVVVPAGVTVIDGTNRYLLPGLTDMHTHFATETAVEAGPGQLLLYVANGVTTVLHQGDFDDPVNTWSNAVRVGTLVGPSIYTSRYARDSRDGTPFSVQVTSAAAANSYVVAAKRLGYDFIKVYNWTRPDVYAALVAEADRQGMAVIGHIPIEVGLTGVLEAGQVMMAHAGFGSYFNTHFGGSVNQGRVASAVNATATAGAWVNPTLAVEEVVASVFGGDGEGEQAVFDQPGVRYVHPATIQRWETKLFTQQLYNPPGAVPGGRDAALAFMKQYTRAFYDAGVRLLVGSDSPTVLLVAGFSIHNELRLLAEIGLTPYQVLEVATRNGGEFINAFQPTSEQFGTIEVGARADLLLLNANPLADLENLKLRAGVMARGQWFTETDLHARLEALAQSYGR